jgi:hypothetical protein
VFEGGFNLSSCEALTNQTGYILTKPPPSGRLQLVHTQSVPRNTPTLAVSFRSPGPSRFKPQGFLMETNDATVANVSYWANWTKARRTYLAGQRVAKFRYVLEASSPRKLGCDWQE